MAKANIMIVEDEAIIGEEIKISLEDMGYTVTSVVKSGEQAIKKADQDRPDLILMDIRLKGRMDGIEAAELIRSRLDIPVIFLTAYADEDKLERAKLSMPFGYILKPFQDRDLKVAIEMGLYAAKLNADRKQAEEQRDKLVLELQDALARVKTLSGMLPICVHCKNIRDDKGYWEKIETYIHDHSGTEFSHCICPECMKKHYPEYVDDDEK